MLRELLKNTKNKQEDQHQLTEAKLLLEVLKDTNNRFLNLKESKLIQEQMLFIRPPQLEELQAKKKRIM